LEKRIAAISSELKKTEIEIGTREEDLAFAQEIFEEKANRHYRLLRFYDPITPFISSENALAVFKEISFRERAIDEDRKTMEELVEDLIKLKQDKETLDKNKTSLTAAQKQLDEKASFLSKEVEKVETYLGTLSAKQQELAALKAG
jgi:peptidoglycan hydrolase CwlO-like protein